MRCLFIGGTRRGYLALEALLDSSAEVTGVFSLRQHPHEMERYEERFQALARSRGLHLVEADRLDGPESLRLVREVFRPEVAFVIGCRVMLPQELIQAPPQGCLAVHDSFLPEYRGFAPLNWALLNGETTTGVTMFRLSEAMDGGEIMAQEEIPVGPAETAPQVYEKVCAATARLVRETYARLLQGRLVGRAQDLSAGSFACARRPEDGLLDWRWPTGKIFNYVRALTWPYPGAFTFWEGRKVTVWAGQPLSQPKVYAGRLPGRVVAVDRSGGGVEVLSGDGVFRLTLIQVEGQDKARPADVLGSTRARLGWRNEDGLARLERLAARLGQKDGDR